ncbi:MAG: purine-nucleoside phosphorylase [Coriobacteriales bacterium]|jgi:purine-nucleoside phosphorylase|nr:purine-nucleoside phosphorylase [Coriobacteriales bacterium]
MSLSARVDEAADVLRPFLGTWGETRDIEHPPTALILGTGLGELAEAIEVTHAVSYTDIPHACAARMPDHAGRLVFGELAGTHVVCMQGRLHAYEGYTALETVFPLLVAERLGARRLVVTNASGAINEQFSVGDIMLVTDHINFTGMSPVTLDADNDVARSCFDMTYAYTPRLRERARRAAASCGMVLREGVYLGLRGPMFETPAEIRMFRSWGADAVGMSTVHEVLMASALRMEVCGLSLLTNMAAGMLDQPLTAEEVVQVGATKGAALGALVEALLV